MIRFDKLKQYEKEAAGRAMADTPASNANKVTRMAVKRMLAYEDEEWDAVLEPELMTPEIFRKCMLTSARIDDFETFMKLAQAHPDYCEELFAQIEKEQG